MLRTPVLAAALALTALAPSAQAQVPPTAVFDLVVTIDPPINETDEPWLGRRTVWSGPAEFVEGPLAGPTSCEIHGTSFEVRLGGGGANSFGSCANGYTFGGMPWNRYGDALYWRGTTRYSPTGPRRSVTGACVTDLLARPYPIATYRIRCVLPY